MVVIRFVPLAPAPTTTMLLATSDAVNGTEVLHVSVVELPPVVIAPSVTVCPSPRAPKSRTFARTNWRQKASEVVPTLMLPCVVRHHWECAFMVPSDTRIETSGVTLAVPVGKSVARLQVAPPADQTY